jgi:hypothetical protein
MYPSIHPSVHTFIHPSFHFHLSILSSNLHSLFIHHEAVSPKGNPKAPASKSIMIKMTHVTNISFEVLLYFRDIHIYRHTDIQTYKYTDIQIYRHTYNRMIITIRIYLLPCMIFCSPGFSEAICGQALPTDSTK